jgi:hypothetical protein
MQVVAFSVVLGLIKKLIKETDKWLEVDFFKAKTFSWLS